MSRPRRYGHDYVYGLDHFERFPEQYQRIAHRFKMADIDWTEFCGYGGCSRPVGIFEMFRDTAKGLDLSDKGVTVARYLARGVGVPAYVVAYLTERPQHVQREIDELNARVLSLTREHPIARFRVQLLEPQRGRIITYTPDQWWDLIAALHSQHHQACRIARRSGDRLANPQWLSRARTRHSGLLGPSGEQLHLGEVG